MSKILKLKSRFEIITTVMMPPEGEEEKTHTYYVIKVTFLCRCDHLNRPCRIAVLPFFCFLSPFPHSQRCHFKSCVAAGHLAFIQWRADSCCLSFVCTKIYYCSALSSYILTQGKLAPQIQGMGLWSICLPEKQMYSYPIVHCSVSELDFI